MVLSKLRRQSRDGITEGVDWRERRAYQHQVRGAKHSTSPSIHQFHAQQQTDSLALVCKQKKEKWANRFEPAAEVDDLPGRYQLGMGLTVPVQSNPLVDMKH